jgi:hypothetical protein
MKAERVKNAGGTPENTEEVSLHPGEKGLGSLETHGATSRAEEKPRSDWEKSLQICGKGTESKKGPCCSWERI